LGTFSNAIIAGVVPATFLPSIAPAHIQRLATNAKEQSLRNPNARAAAFLVLCYVSARSLSMRRRSFLIGTASAALGLGVYGRARAGGRVHVAVAHDAPGRQIPSDFIGLSYESAALVGGRYFTDDNRSVLGLIRLLGRDGVIRIGGNTSERTVWPASDEPLPQDSFVVTPAGIDGLAAALRVVGWKLIYGLNLARGTADAAAEEASYVARAVGGNLLAFQIGNEPDGFGRWTAVRPQTYDFNAYLAEWRAFRAAIAARVPQARFAGPDVASDTTWVGQLAAQEREHLVLLTRHYYADGPAGAPGVSLGKLLRSDQQIVPMLDELARVSRTNRLPFRIVEANSVFGEGQPGVSDTLSAALWALELMFELAAAGASGVNFHAGVHNLRAGEDKAYTPIARSGGGRYRAAPLYYGMLAFAQAARGTLVPARVAPATDGLRAFAVRAFDKTQRIVVINKHMRDGVELTIDPGRDRVTAAAVTRLVGSRVDATEGVTFGGASVDDFGQWTPAHQEAPVTGNEIAIDLPAASAAVVTVTM
jgi:hypothetical protein